MFSSVFKTRMDDRYSRLDLFLGKKNRELLSKKRVAVIGVGALGSKAGHLLARAGVGSLVLADRDVVEIENVYSQLFSPRDVGKPKAVVEKERVEQINRSVKATALVDDVNRKNIERVVKQADLVLDCTDNFSTRFLINEACVKNRVALVSASCVRAQGSVTAFSSGTGPCLRCVFQKAPDRAETCDTVGVLNEASMIVASLQVVEALKILTGQAREPRFLFVDAWKPSVEEAKIVKNAKCQVCVKRDFALLASRNSETAVLCGMGAVQVNPGKPVNKQKLVAGLKKAGVHTRQNEFFVNFKVKDFEFTVFENGRAIIKGVNDEKKAKTLYAQYVGS